MSLIFPSPQEAEAAFYEAFQNGNIEAMMAVWSSDDDIICIHPNSPRLQGRALIAESWQQIFSSEAEVRFEIADAQYIQDALLSIHIVHEYIYLNGDRRRRPPVIATNVYQLTSNGWRMILHHGSSSPEMRAQTDINSPAILH